MAEKLTKYQKAKTKNNSINFRIKQNGKNCYLCK